MSDFEQQVLTDLAELKAQMKQMLGNGQPGRLALLEQRVERHESQLQRASGLGAALLFVITLVQFWMNYLRIFRR